MLVTALVNPINAIADVAPRGAYESGAFFSGFLQGYDTLDALASLAFGIIVIQTVRQLGVQELQRRRCLRHHRPALFRKGRELDFGGYRDLVLHEDGHWLGGLLQ